MKRLILSTAVYLLVIDLSVANAAESFQKNNRSPAYWNTPVTVAGFFDGLRKSVDDLTDSIKSMRDTVSEVKSLSDDLTGKQSQSFSTNESSTETSATEAERTSKTDQQGNDDEY